VAHLSRGKAKDVAQRHKKAVVLGADTIIVYKDKILGKPHTQKEQRNVEDVSGKQHSAITVFTVIDTENNNTISNP